MAPQQAEWKRAGVEVGLAAAIPAGGSAVVLAIDADRNSASDDGMGCP